MDSEWDERKQTLREELPGQIRENPMLSANANY
jgi:hypothetical protein